MVEEIVKYFDYSLSSSINKIVINPVGLINCIHPFDQQRAVSECTKP
jgi:hypothetical protein